MQVRGAAQGVACFANGRVSGIRSPTFEVDLVWSFAVKRQVQTITSTTVPSLLRCRRWCLQEMDERGRKDTIRHCHNTLTCQELRRKALNYNALHRHLDIGEF